MSDEADNVVLRLLREMRAEMATRGDLKELRSEVDDLRHDVSEGFTTVTRALSEALSR